MLRRSFLDHSKKALNLTSENGCFMIAKTARNRSFFSRTVVAWSSVVLLVRPFDPSSSNHSFPLRADIKFIAAKI